MYLLLCIPGVVSPDSEGLKAYSTGTYCLMLTDCIESAHGLKAKRSQPQIPITLYSSIAHRQPRNLRLKAQSPHFPVLQDFHRRPRYQRPESLRLQVPTAVYFSIAHRQPK